MKRNVFRKSLVVALLLIMQLMWHSGASGQAPMRRAISPSSPMWLIHIDTWNWADPKKIIDLIPQDIRPYVVMNISLSISHDVATSRFKVAEYGYEIAKSWVRTCAENKMWCMIQPSSGGYTQFSDFDLSVYREFFQNYPNVIGFNYCEQFWGYDDATDKLSPTWTNRITHFADMLKLCNEYGGYLAVSWCGNQWSPSINPIGMLKRNAAFAAASSKYTENFILMEKYTQQGYQYDMESICLGSYLSGLSGYYGCRYDDTGWTDLTGTHANFTMATQGAVNLEHIMLTGQTVLDGPELIWTQCFKETNRTTDADGFTRRNWETFPQFDNVSVDLFRKVIDGTVRIPTRKEVIDRTKYVIVNDVASGTTNDIYSTPQTMFEGLYQMDGNYENNKTFFKKSGRYPTIPTVFKLDDELANTFKNVVNKSAYATRWSTVASKVAEFDTEFPQEYTGSIYAGRHENAWVVYNPIKKDTCVKGNISLKYNTCTSVDVSLSQYTAGIVKEYANKLDIYLSNYDNVLNTGLKPDTFKIYGSTTEPTFSYTERGNHQASVLTSDWTSGVYTLVVKHNGALDITINCSGSATDRLTTYTTASLTAPLTAPVYTGTRQYEAECWDYKNITGITTGGYEGSIRNYTGQGYLEFGTNASASVRDNVNVPVSGSYFISFKYSTTIAAVSTIDLYVNGSKVATPTFETSATNSEWKTVKQLISLNAGDNTIVLQANAAGSSSIFFDNITIDAAAGSNIYTFSGDVASTSAKTPAAELITMKSGSAGVIAYTNAANVTNNCFKTYSVGTTNGSAAADLDMFNPASTDYFVTWKEYYGTTGGKKGILLRGSGSCAYADGMKQGYLFIALNNADNTVTLKPYTASSTGLSAKTTYTSTFKVNPGEPCWYRASATGSVLTFECSKDSISWEGAGTATFTDATYTTGSTQLVWGLNSNNYTWCVDNIACATSSISVSKFALPLISYTQGAGPSTEQTFTISASALKSAIQLNATENFEISLSQTENYASSLTINPVNGSQAITTIYVRLKAGLTINAYTGTITVASGSVPAKTVSLEGKVVPVAVFKQYDFSGDLATTSAQTPPANYASIPQSSTATCGVVSYTDSKNVTSNMIKPYSGGNRNSTGVVNLDFFSRKSTDYTVTWKACVNASKEYKVGMLLRGDTSKVGDESTGYVQGLMQGYLFIAYSTGTSSQFRIYRSTSTYNALTMLVNTTVSTLVPTSAQPVWYRASATGSGPVALKFEYSTDSITWNVGSSTTDNTSVFTQGATQMVWGLGVSNLDFYVDNITFKGIESATGSLPGVYLSDNTLDETNYVKNNGPSAATGFSVYGQVLTTDVLLTAPENFEISLNSTDSYASTLNISPVQGMLSRTPVYVRLKSGLDANSYTGNISITSTGVSEQFVAVSGIVKPEPVVTVDGATFNEFGYNFDEGPSMAQFFTVSGENLLGEIKIDAPASYEVSLSQTDNYTTSVSLSPTTGTVASTTIYLRLKAGLAKDTYSESLSISSQNTENKTIALEGKVSPATGIGTVGNVEKDVINTEYFSVLGQKIDKVDNMEGLFIVKKTFKDGNIHVSKIFIRKGKK